MEAVKRVGAWIRVSTDLQVKDDSPEHHERRARAYAEAKGWHIAEVYRLDAVSGKSVMEQPEAKRMLKDIKRGHITGLIFSKLARLARNTRELLDFADIFKSHNADLISLAESIDTSTPAGRLFYTMIAAMATWEREEIAERVAASVPIRAQMGKPLGGAASFGYRWENNNLIVDETEAPVRKLMYELFVKHKRKKAVASELTKMGYRTRNGSWFSGTTIDRLIRDTTAKGLRIANHTKSLGEGKKWISKPKEEWITIPCAPIVPEELWNEANGILDAQTVKRKPGPRTVHLLAGYVTCTCGAKMYVFNRTVSYSCRKCKNRIAVADIDEIYHQQLKSFLLTDADIAEYTRKSDAVLREKEELLTHTVAEVERIGKRMSELVNLHLDSSLSKDAFLKEHKPLEAQYLQLREQHPVLEAEVDYLRVQNQSSDTIREDAKNLYDRWEILPTDEKRSIVEVITDSITVGKSDIHVALAYLPAPLLLQNSLKGEHNPAPVDSIIIRPGNVPVRLVRCRNT